jgi:hypothetical protein
LIWAPGSDALKAAGAEHKYSEHGVTVISRAKLEGSDAVRTNVVMEGKGGRSRTVRLWAHSVGSAAGPRSKVPLVTVAERRQPIVITFLPDEKREETTHAAIFQAADAWLRTAGITMPQTVYLPQTGTWGWNVRYRCRSQQEEDSLMAASGMSNEIYASYLRKEDQHFKMIWLKRAEVEMEWGKAHTQAIALKPEGGLTRAWSGDFAIRVKEQSFAAAYAKIRGTEELEATRQGVYHILGSPRSQTDEEMLDFGRSIGWRFVILRRYMDGKSKQRAFAVRAASAPPGTMFDTTAGARLRIITEKEPTSSSDGAADVAMGGGELDDELENAAALAVQARACAAMIEAHSTKAWRAPSCGSSEQDNSCDGELNDEEDEAKFRRDNGLAPHSTDANPRPAKRVASSKLAGGWLTKTGKNKDAPMG